MLPQLPSCTHPWGRVPSTGYPAQGTQHRAPSPSLHPPAGDCPQGASSASCWGPCAGTGTVAPGCGSAGPARHGAESITCTGALWFARTSQEARLHRAPSPKLGPSGEKRIPPRAVCRAEAMGGPAGADPARTLPADGDQAMLRLTPSQHCLHSQGHPKVICLHEWLQDKIGGRQGAGEPFTPYSQTRCGPRHPGYPKATPSPIRPHSLVASGRRW